MNVMSQRTHHSFTDHIVALVIAIALPIVGFVCLLSLRMDATRLHVPAKDEGLTVIWLPASKAPPLHSPSLTTPRKVVELTPAADELPAKTEPSAAEQQSNEDNVEEAAQPPVSPQPDEAMQATALDGSVFGLPVDAGGSVYDPSKAGALTTPSSARLRSPSARDDAMARIQTSSLMESLPEFPAALFLAGASPTAVVSVSVDAAGVPTGATVDLSSGDIDVDSAICGVVRSWRFDPELRDGLPVASNEVITLNFELASDAR